MRGFRVVVFKRKQENARNNRYRFPGFVDAGSTTSGAVSGKINGSRRGSMSNSYDVSSTGSQSRFLWSGSSASIRKLAICR